MRTAPKRPIFGRPFRYLVPIGLGGVLFAAGIVTAAQASATPASQPPVQLGTAGSFAVLGGQTVTNTGPSSIQGSVGLSPGSSVTGFPPGKITNGTLQVADSAAQTAKADLSTAYLDAASRTPSIPVSSLSQNLNLGGLTLSPGVYSSASYLNLTGTVTLNANNDPSAVFIFQTVSTLEAASSSTVLLTGQAQACNVFWQVGSSATLGTGSNFAGTIMASTSASVKTGASVDGRVLAETGSVTLDSNLITVPTCSTVVPPNSTTTSTTSTTVVSSPTLSTSVSATSIPLNGSVNDTATITAGAISGGVVQFYLCAPNSTYCSPTSGSPVGPAQPVTDGRAISPTITPASPGTYCFGALYSTDTSGQTLSEVGTVYNGECFTVSAAAASVVPTTIPHASSAGTATSVVVPSTHTGEPWKSHSYLIILAASGLVGTLLVGESLRRRRHSSN